MTILLLVAPRAGAWIETAPATAVAVVAVSPLAQGRGLKLSIADSLETYRRRPSRRSVD